MKKFLEKFASLTAALMIVAMFLSAPMLAAAPSAEDIRRGVAASGGSGDASRIDGIIVVAINIFSLIVGIAAVIMIIIGGLKYVTSVGDTTSINSAKNTILYAVVGLIVVALAQIIARFVIDRV
jgi:hypothetical protein